MREDAAIAREQFCFGGDDLAALGHDAALGAHEAGVQRDWPREVTFGLDGGVARACRQQRVGGASGCAIDQRERPTAVNRAVRIEYVRAGFAFEHGEAIADFVFAIAGPGMRPSIIACRSSLPLMPAASGRLDKSWSWVVMCG